MSYNCTMCNKKDVGTYSIDKYVAERFIHKYSVPLCKKCYGRLLSEKYTESDFINEFMKRYPKTGKQYAI